MSTALSTITGNSQKVPFAQSLQKLTRAKAQDAVAALGKGLPCTVASVTGPGVVVVNFSVNAAPAILPQMEMPVCKFSFIKFPLAKGNIGVALSADLLTGGLTGLGTGVPNLQDTTPNLGAMTFFPLGSTSEEFIDPEALDLYSNILCTPTELAFFGGGKVAKQTVVGPLSTVTDASAKAVLTSIIEALASYGLIADETT